MTVEAHQQLCDHMRECFAKALEKRGLRHDAARVRTVTSTAFCLAAMDACLSAWLFGIEDAAMLVEPESPEIASYIRRTAPTIKRGPPV